MTNRFSINSTKIIKYSKLYFFITSILFLSIPIDIMPQISERFQMLIIVLLCYCTFYHIIGISLVKNISYNKHNLNSLKKMANLQLNLFLFLGTTGLGINLLLVLSNTKNITLHLLLTNISLAMINGAFRKKDIYNDSYNKKYNRK